MDVTISCCHQTAKLTTFSKKAAETNKESVQINVPPSPPPPPFHVVKRSEIGHRPNVTSGRLVHVLM